MDNVAENDATADDDDRMMDDVMAEEMSDHHKQYKQDGDNETNHRLDEPGSSSDIDDDETSVLFSWFYKFHFPLILYFAIVPWNIRPPKKLMRLKCPPLHLFDDLIFLSFGTLVDFHDSK